MGTIGASGETGDRIEPSPGTEPHPGDPVAPPPAGFSLGAGGLRRLSRTEFDNVLRDLVGETARPGHAKLPEDSADPFDNDYSAQIASGDLIESLETIATEAASRALADATRRDALVGCKPTGPDDAACLRKFVTTFGRRALRRPLTEDEIRGYLALGALGVEDKSFYTAAGLVLRAFLQDPELVYQVEIGTPVAGLPGLHRLTSFELGSRLSFFLVGSTPADALLDAAQTGKLAESELRGAAVTLLADARARQRFAHFHALWLGYGQLPVPAALAEPMRAESDGLVERVLFDGSRDYFELFRATDSFVNDTLAAHYGLPKPGSSSGKWVSYGAAPRRGILSHATVLSNGAKFNDTSPTLRGKFIIERLLCAKVPPPPDNVDTDLKPQGGSSRCKVDRYQAHRDTAAGCAACHLVIDPVGWGLENYGRDGKYRTVETEAPECAIKGEGTLPGFGPFRGPGELGELLARSGQLEGCLVGELHRFAFGRPFREADRPTVDRLTRTFRDGGRQFRELVLGLVTSPAFFHRQAEEQAP